MNIRSIALVGALLLVVATATADQLSDGGVLGFVESGLQLSGGTLTGDITIGNGTTTSPELAFDTTIPDVFGFFVQGGNPILYTIHNMTYQIDYDSDGSSIYNWRAGSKTAGGGTSLMKLDETGLLEIVPSGGRISNNGSDLVLGDACTTSHSLTIGDVCVGDQLEVNGTLWADAGIVSGGAVSVPNAANFTVGASSSVANYLNLRNNSTFAQASLGVGVSSGYQLVIADGASYTSDIGHAADGDGDPITYFQGAGTTAGNHVRVGYDTGASVGVIGVGSGDLKIEDDGGKGVASYIRTNTETLTFAANPGDATKVTSSLSPVDVTVLGVTSRVTTAGTNCTSIQLGDGSDADMFSSATMAVTQGTTSDNTDHTASTKMGYQTGAFNATVTANGGNCFDLVVDVTVHYLDVSAATSN